MHNIKQFDKYFEEGERFESFFDDLLNGKIFFVTQNYQNNFIKQNYDNYKLWQSKVLRFIMEYYPSEYELIKDKVDKYAGSDKYSANLGNIMMLLRSIKEVPDMKDMISNTKNISAQGTENVFIVHGHDELMKQEVANTVSRLKLVPIILNERHNGGDTIIEKLEHNAEQVNYAIILLSPCDHGAEIQSTDLKPRARQNVILEMGYFIGKIGRNKVCVLKKDDVEEPSDVFGVVYTPYDRFGAWKLKLADELKAAGFRIDKNLL